VAARIGVVRTIVERQGSTVAAIEELGSIGVVLEVIVGTIATVMVEAMEVPKHIAVAKLKLATSTTSEELTVAKEAFATRRIVVAGLP
jgi:hypothetical protein